MHFGLTNEGLISSGSVREGFQPNIPDTPIVDFIAVRLQLAPSQTSKAGLESKEVKNFYRLEDNSNNEFDFKGTISTIKIRLYNIKRRSLEPVGGALC